MLCGILPRFAMACVVERSYLVVSFFRAYMALLLLVDTSRIDAYLYVVAYLGYLFTENNMWLPWKSCSK